MQATDSIKSRYTELVAKINEANLHYYKENAPLISDYDYDHLMYELQDIEKQYPELVTPDSPTQKVGSDLSESSNNVKLVHDEGNFAKCPHKYPMLSLGNTYSIQDVEEFAARAGKTIGGAFSYSCELKFDGTAICLTYKNGRLEKALTRGDGEKGDDVTVNVAHISNIPQRLSGFGWPEEFEIRGEIYMPYKAFDRLNAEKERNEETPFANPRNAASGSLKLTNPDEVGERGLECTLYHMLGENLPFETHDQALRAAMKWGLPVSDKRKLCRNIVEIEEYINHWDTARKFLPFATDGIVIKVNELPYQAELGYTAKAPRWAVAYKFKAEQALTKVTSIDFQVGRTGAVTPVANLEPVQLSGTVVKRATLHNGDMMEALDIHVGDYVYVEKGGEIIPKITAVEPSKRSADAYKPKFPETCPDCGAKLVRDEGEAKWFCPNVDGCPTQVKGKIVHFMSRKAMNVLAGDATIDQFYAHGYVKNVADLYDLTKNDLLHLDGWQERSADRFLESLRASAEKTPFESVLFALGIRYVGEQTAKAIARHFGDMDSVLNAGREALLGVEDVGDVIADAVVAWSADPAHREIVARLREKGLKMVGEKKADAPLSDALAGKTIVVSGNFTISRDDIKELIVKHSGKVSGSLSKKTSFLLAGEKPGPEKVKKAHELGTEILTELDFYRLLPSASSDEAAGSEESVAEAAPVAEEYIPDEGIQLSLF